MTNKARRTPEERMAEVRRRVIVDFFVGAAPESPHWWNCRACGYSWRYGEKERHESGCPMQEEP